LDQLVEEIVVVADAVVAVVADATVVVAVVAVVDIVAAAVVAVVHHLYCYLRFVLDQCYKTFYKRSL
jgi:hypothetical protein